MTKDEMKKLVRTELEGAIRDQLQAWDAAERVQSITGNAEDVSSNLIELAGTREYEEPTEQELDVFIPPANLSEAMRKLVRPEVEAAIRLQRQSWEAVDRIQEITGFQGDLICDVMDLCDRRRDNGEFPDVEMDFLFPVTKEPDSTAVPS